jgi:predicted PurR-regulated permease PerM
MPKNKTPIYINVTTLGIIKIIFIFILFYFLFIIRDILAVLFISLILSSAIDPIVDVMHKKRIPRALGVIFIYLFIFFIVGGVIYLIIPPIIDQASELSQKFPIFETVLSGLNTLKEVFLENGALSFLEDNFSSFSPNLQNAASGVFNTVTGIFGTIFSFLLIMVMTFYMTVEENSVKKIIWSIVPEENQVYIMHLVNRMQKKIGLWLRGQLILSLIIFILTFIGLSILGVKYALILALIAGLTEFVPYLGPIFASIPALFLSFTQGGFMFMIFVGILYYIIQVVENNIIVPKLMQKAVGLNPIIIFAVLMIGFQVAGPIGAILSIPVATALSVFLIDFFDNKTRGAKDLVED